MKKIYKGMLLSVLGVVLFMPVMAKAIGFDLACGKAELCDNGKCKQTCTVTVTGNTGLAENTTVSGKVTLTNPTGTKITAIKTDETKFLSESNFSTNPATLKFTSFAAISDSSFTLATITVETTQNQDCSLEFELEGVTKKVDPNPTPENPKTGATMPIAIISTGALAAAAIYLTTRKNTKLYKI